MIPILDLAAQYRDIKAQIDEAVAKVLAGGVFIMGPNVEAFESEIAAYLGTKHAVSLNSGTDALHLALRALRIGVGDEVITTPFTFAATTEAIGIVGARPIFVDIDPGTYNIDARLIEAAITPRTRAILPVHLYGEPADLDTITGIARRRGLAVVEDCAQAIGAKVAGRQVGTFGEIGCFSFFPTKNLGAYGDGGLAITNDDALASRLRSLRAHGATKKYYHDELGINSRLDELQAAILRVKLPYLNLWIAARRKIAYNYDEVFGAERAISKPPRTAGSVYHQYTIRAARREEIRRNLTGERIQSMIYYPVPLHLQHVNQYLGYKVGDYPIAEEAAETVLSLPIYPELEESDQERVCNSVREALTDAGAPRL